MSERSTPLTRVVSRDTLTWLVSIGLMVYQGVWADPFNTTVFLGAMIGAGIPGVLQGIALLTGRTGGESLPSPAPPSSPEPSSSSSGA